MNKKSKQLNQTKKVRSGVPAHGSTSLMNKKKVNSCTKLKKVRNEVPAQNRIPAFLPAFTARTGRILRRVLMGALFLVYG